jgi:hypothetical protein
MLRLCLGESLTTDAPFQREYHVHELHIISSVTVCCLLALCLMPLASSFDVHISALC